MRCYFIINNLFQHFEELWPKMLPPDLKLCVYFVLLTLYLSTNHIIFLSIIILYIEKKIKVRYFMQYQQLIFCLNLHKHTVLAVRFSQSRAQKDAANYQAALSHTMSIWHLLQFFVANKGQSTPNSDHQIAASTRLRFVKNLHFYTHTRQGFQMSNCYFQLEFVYTLVLFELTF